MGGWMTYRRMRARNGSDWRPADDVRDPYPRGDERPSDVNWHRLVGDINRMERDYLEPVYPQDVPGSQVLRVRGTSPAEECAAATGVDVEVVRAVLAYVFRDQR